MPHENFQETLLKPITKVLDNKALEAIQKVADATRMNKTRGYFEQADILIRQSDPERHGKLTRQHVVLSVLLEDPNLQTDIHMLRLKGSNGDRLRVVYDERMSYTYKGLDALDAIIKEPNFQEKMLKYDNTGDLRHDDFLNLKSPQDRDGARKTYDRINAEMSALFKPAFQKIVDVNASNSKTHSMQAQFGKTSLATMDMAGRFMMTLALENKSQITFKSTSEDLFGNKKMAVEYQKVWVESYEGKEEEFRDMVTEVADHIGKEPTLSDVLKPKSVVFAGIVIT